MDKEMIEICEAMNDTGKIVTYGSCIGHGENKLWMATGVVESFSEHNGYISFHCKYDYLDELFAIIDAIKNPQLDLSINYSREVYASQCGIEEGEGWIAFDLQIRCPIEQERIEIVNKLTEYFKKSIQGKNKRLIKKYKCVC
jgi:hypothetical protein